MDEEQVSFAQDLLHFSEAEDRKLVVEENSEVEEVRSKENEQNLIKKEKENDEEHEKEDKESLQIEKISENNDGKEEIHPKDEQTEPEAEEEDSVDNTTDFFIPLDNLTEYLGEEIFLRFVRADVFVRREPDAVGTPGNANLIVDQLISKIQQLIEDRDLSEVKSLDVNKSILWLVVNGLDTIKRTGDATIRIEGNTIVVEANIGFSDISIFCSLNHQLKWFIRLNGKAFARTSDLFGFAKFRILLLDNLQLNLEDFQVKNWGDLRVKLTGDNCFGSMAGFFINNFQRTVTNIIKEKVPPLILSTIQKKLTQLEFLNAESSKKAVATLLSKQNETDSVQKQNEQKSNHDTELTSTPQSCSVLID